MAGKLQQFYDRRYEKGLCIYCGEHPFTPGKKTCQECRNKKAKARQQKPKKIMSQAEAEKLMYTTECVNCYKEE